MMERLYLYFSASWQLLKVFVQLMYGIWKVSGLPAPRVTIFGGSRFGHDDPYVKQAHMLAQLFVKTNISVITGGGPGIMEAISCVVSKNGKAKSLGIGVLGR